MKHLYLFAASCIPFLAAGQSVGIGTSSPSGSAALEVRSTSKGLLLPRLTTTQMNAVASPEEGLLIYNTTQGKLYCYQRSSTTEVTTAENNTTPAFAVPASNGALFGQSVTATASGKLTGFTVILSANVATTVGLTLKVYAGGGTGGTELGTVTQSVPVTSTNTTTTFDLSGLDLLLAAGQVYTFYFTAASFSNSAVLNYRTSNNSNYAGGQLYSAGANPSTQDMLFRVTVLPAAWVAVQ